MDPIRDAEVTEEGGAPTPAAPLRLTASDRILARLDDLARLLAASPALATPAAPPGEDARRLVAEAEARLSAQIAMQGQIIDALMAERDRADHALAALATRLDLVEGRSGTAPGEGALQACADRLGELLLRLEGLALDRLGAAPPLRATLATLAEQVALLEARLAAEVAPPPSRMIDAAPATAPEDFRAALAEVLSPGDRAA